MFQSTLPRGERPTQAAIRAGYSAFQSTLPRGERRRGQCGQRLLRHVSIHAPARGATNVTAREVAAKEVSIHAPARGATTYHRDVFGTICCFNPRSREGSDGSNGPLVVQVHCFNPLSREGSDGL